MNRFQLHPQLLCAFLGRLLPAAFVLVASLAVMGQPSRERELASPEELVFLLEYVAVDYGLAVQNGEIVNALEYQEMRVLSQLLVDQFEVLRDRGASERIRTDLGELQYLIRHVRPWSEVKGLANDLAQELLIGLDIVALPVQAPDLTRGSELYEPNCAACHGRTGDGAGPSSPAMSPPPTSFLDPRMNLVSPHQVYGAITFGIEGTAHPSYRYALTPEETWDIAFFLMTLRDGFDPRRPAEDLPLTLGDLATRSNEDLLAQVRRARPDAELPHVDYYRKSPPGTASAVPR
jgi:high-affinity iron transporter